jgi:hypothetical protein
MRHFVERDRHDHGDGNGRQLIERVVHGRPSHSSRRIENSTVSRTRAGPGAALVAHQAFFHAAKLAHGGLAARVEPVHLEHNALQAAGKGMVDHQPPEPAIEAGAAQGGHDEAVADLDRPARRAMFEPAGHPGNHAIGQDRIDPALRRAAQQAIELHVEIGAEIVVRIDRPDFGVLRTGRAQPSRWRLASGSSARVPSARGT